MAPTSIPAQWQCATHQNFADLIAESGAASRSDALNWLLHSANGRSLFLRSLGKRLERRKTKKETPTMTNFNPEQSMIIAKGAPTNFVDCVAKDLITGDPYELTNAAAKAANPGLTEARAFAKFVNDYPVLQQYAFAPVDPHSYLQGEPLHKVGGRSGPMPLTAPVYTGGEEGSRVRTSTDPRS